MENLITKQDELINEILEKYSEWIQEAEIREDGGYQKVLIQIMASIILKERKERGDRR